MKELLSDAIDDYLRHRKSQDYSKGTLNCDRQVLKRFLSITGNVWCHSITERHVERHFDVASLKRQASSLKNDHSVLIGFFRWARHTRRMPVDSDPMFGRRQPKRTERERNRVPVTDFPRLLDAAGERDPRDRALIAVLLYTLMRDSEVRDLRVRDLKLSEGRLAARIWKTKQEDLMPVSSELDEEMRNWLVHYEEVVGRLEPHHYLIPARGVHPVWGENGRITHHNSLYRPEKNIRESGRIVSPILERIGFPITDADGKPCGEGAHTIRRSGARALFDGLVDTGYDHSLRVVQSMLHHKSMQMTERYLGITADRRSRDDLIRGQRMYATEAGNVLQMAR